MDARSSLSFVVALILLTFHCSTISAQPASSSLVRRVYETTEIKVDKKKHDVQFFNFVTVCSTIPANDASIIRR